MVQSVLLVGVLGVFLASIWLYWQVKQTESRILQVEAGLLERSRLMNDVVDEVVASIHQMYREMDRCLIRLDQAEVGDVQEDIPETVEPYSETPFSGENEGEDPLSSPDGARTDEHLSKMGVAPDPESAGGSSGKMVFQDTPSLTEVDMVDPVTQPPYAQAIQMAAKGMDFVEIAKHIDMGIEELRLLLQFRGQRFTAS